MTELITAIAMTIVLGASTLTVAAFSATYTPIASVIWLIISSSLVALGIAFLSLGIGFLEGKKWSWTLGFIVTATTMILGNVLVGVAVVPYFSSNVSDALALTVAFNGPSGAIGLSFIYYLPRQHVKAFLTRN